MSKYKKIFILFAISLAVLFSLLFLMPKYDNYRMEKRGNEMIKVIEKFKNENGRLPESLDEMGLVDDMYTQPFYGKLGEEGYILYYGWDFDRGYGYFSKTGKWRNTY